MKNKRAYNQRYKYWKKYYEERYPTLLQYGLDIHLVVEARLAKELNIRSRLEKLEV